MKIIRSHLEGFLYLLLWAILAALFLAGLISQGPGALGAAAELQIHPARLLNDFTAIAGPGAALMNATVTAAVALLLVWRSKISLSGPTIAAVFTVLGFGLFGKTVLNILPILLGVALSAKVIGRTFGEYIIIALFGTALGPLVSAVALETGLTGIPAVAVALLGGVGAGFLLPPLAMTMLRLHQGYNLYNLGLTTGFLALFVAAALNASGASLDIAVVWNSDPSPLLVYLIPVLSLVLIAAALLAGGGAISGDLRAIMKISGRLPSDFVSSVSPGGALLNMGLMGLAGWAYVLIVGGDLNGPVLGGIFTVIGFASFGKHPRNTLPVVAGLVVAALLFGKPLNSPSPLLAALFVTTLAPLAGEFGMRLGFTAGFLHLILVLQTTSWHGGISLYNNGFAGGLTATLLVAVIEWRRNNQKTATTFGGKRK